MKDIVSMIREDVILSHLKQPLLEEKDKLQAEYEKFGEKWKETDELKDTVKEIEEMDNDSNLKVSQVFLVNDSHYVLKIHGGLNGSGNWKDYLKDMQAIIDKLKTGYVIDLEVDVPDDVWVLYIGKSKNEK